MFKPLSSLFSDREVKADAEDARRYIEGWLRDELQTQKLYCAQVSGRRAEVRVGSADLIAEVRMREYDVCRAVEEALGYELEEVYSMTTV